MGVKDEVSSKSKLPDMLQGHTEGGVTWIQEICYYVDVSKGANHGHHNIRRSPKMTLCWDALCCP